MRFLTAAAVTCVAAMGLLIACAGASPSAEPTPTAAPASSQPTEANTNQAKAEVPAELSAWVVYWDTEPVASEAASIGGLDALFHFSALFRPDGKLFTPEETTVLFQSLNSAPTGGDTLHYLTAVNDVMDEDGNALVKDTDILVPLLADKESRAAHIADLLSVAEGYDGIEIDYETLHRREGGLAKNFALFVGELWDETEKAGLRLRVVLEPLFPVAEIPMPEGPEYAVMLYNLYGNHSGPGPKADAPFIQQTVGTMEALPGDVVYAFATGGYDWNASGSAVGELTELAAVKLLGESGAKEKRDEASGCVTFSYPAADGEHTVWYADGETLAFWMDTAYGVSGSRRFAIWRLGGNSPDSLAALGLEAGEK